jgi:hypothetical protein
MVKAGLGLFGERTSTEIGGIFNTTLKILVVKTLVKI